MKLLAFTDLHASKTKLKILLKKAEFADILLCAGDISSFSHNLKKILLNFKHLKKPVLIIPGNHETPQDLEKVNLPFLIPIHKKICKINNWVFIGYGTDGFSREDRGFERFILKAKEKIKPEDKVILVTHGPPYNTKLDYLPLYGHAGNKSYRRAISILKPDFYFSGHLHENFKKIDKIGKTLLLNPGPDGKLINIQ